jgi:hypothetical protein
MAHVPEVVNLLLFSSASGPYILFDTNLGSKPSAVPVAWVMQGKGLPHDRRRGGLIVRLSFITNVFQVGKPIFGMVIMRDEDTVNLRG